MEIDYALLGARIAEYRKRRKLTQEKLAEMTEMSNNYISHIENCRSIPSLETFIKLCSALGATPSELLLGVEVKSPDYLSSDISQKLSICSPREKRMVNRFIDLLLSEREG